MVVLKSRREIEVIACAGRIVAETIELLGRMIAPSVRTVDMDAAAAEYIRSRGGVPAFKGYKGFPANICISMNEEVVHGIPSQREVRAGDLVSVDVGVGYESYYADGAATFPAGEVEEDWTRLLSVCRDALMGGIREVRPGNRLSAVSRAIQTLVESQGFSVVREYAGHGVGASVHEDPQIPNFVDHESKRKDLDIQEGMVLAIEPMINAGTWEVETLGDGWTVVTKDRKPSAHFEHTVAVVPGGYRVLTALDGGAAAWQ